MFVSIHVVVLVLAACEEDGCWFLKKKACKNAHCIAKIASVCIA